jgi:putative ABC transport system substrate-binding protein
MLACLLAGKGQRMRFDRVKRRELIALLGGAAVWPLWACAQQAAMPVIGFLNSASSSKYEHMAAAFRQGLSEIGYVEGRSVLVEYRYAENRYDRLPEMAADLVRRQVVLIAANTPAAPAAKAATTTIPIVFVTASDPVAAGLVASLNRPAGNLTGVALLNDELGAKRLQLLHELIPAANLMAALINPTHPGAETQSRDVQAAARTLGLQLHVLHASSERDLERAFATVVELRAGGLVVGSDGFFINHSEQLAALALRHAVPTIFLYREFIAAGGVMSYGGSLTDGCRLMGAYAGRILKGEKPADLPVQQATKLELIINLRTARALGIMMPLPLLGRADELIE